MNESNLFLNAVFGDGCVSYNRARAKGTVPVRFGSSNKSLIEYKASIIGGNVNQGTQDVSSWSPGKSVYSTTKAMENPFPGKSKFELISYLTYEDLLLWILDDGSYHKRNGFLNLNSHALSRSENIELAFHLWHSLGIESRILVDKKKDGRFFFYQYIPAAQYDSIKPDVLNFLRENNIEGFDYKVGIGEYQKND
jgi:hypothetical protein